MYLGEGEIEHLIGSHSHLIHSSRYKEKMSNIYPQRIERLDWQLIAEIEPVVVVMGAPEESEKLQGILSGIAFCNLDAEFGKELLESTRGLAKLFRLAQLIIQYLVYCQVGITNISGFPFDFNVIFFTGSAFFPNRKK